jgi:hypothetical protein
MPASQKCNPFWSISVTFSVSPGFCIRFLLSDFGNHCNYRGNRICLVNCHRNTWSVLCMGVGTRLANHYLVMGESESESYIMTDGRLDSLSWNKAPIWSLRPDLDYCQTVVGLLMWGVLSHERMGLSFAIATGPRQHSHSRVRVPSDSGPYFTVSDLRLPFSSPPTTRRVTV